MMGSGHVSGPKKLRDFDHDPISLCIAIHHAPNDCNLQLLIAEAFDQGMMNLLVYRATN
jgi:hypothetical protein